MTTSGPATTSTEACWSGSTIVGGCVLVTVLATGLLHVTGSGLVDPLQTVISDYVAVPWGYGLLAVAALALATASVVLASGLRPAGLPRPAAPTALLVSGAAALAVAAVFPTNLPGTPVGVVANVHRAGGGVVFVALPLAGWMIARRASGMPETSTWARHAPALRRCAALAALISSAFLLTYVPIVIAGSPGIPYIGGSERVLCAAVMVVLLTTARATRTAIDGAQMTGETTPAATVAPIGRAA